MRLAASPQEGVPRPKPHLSQSRLPKQGCTSLLAEGRSAGGSYGTKFPSPRQSFQYLDLLSRRAREPSCCPPLFLAPMENLADRPMRIALHSVIGGFDEACTEFIRVPKSGPSPDAVAKALASSYQADELGTTPLGAQLMGNNPELLYATAARLVEVHGAPRIDLNAGCPANVVTGAGAGSSLLTVPHRLEALVAGLVAAVGGAVPVSVKMRSGFQDTALFEDNLAAAQSGGAAFVTIHPRTKVQSYHGPADWRLIALAKQKLRIPVVGNGDVVSVQVAEELWQTTGCDGIMIGRGALQDPLLFLRIKAAFARRCQHQAVQQQNAQEQDSFDGSAGCCHDEPAMVQEFLRVYASMGFDGKTTTTPDLSQSGRLGRLKKVMKYVFAGQTDLRAACSSLLRVQPGQMTPEQLLEEMCNQVSMHWRPGGPTEQILVNHMTMPGREKRVWLPSERASQPAVVQVCT